MKISVVISSLPQRTTNQLVGLSIAEELEQRGHKVDLYCLGHITREQIYKSFGKQIRGNIFGRSWFWSPGSTIYDYLIQALLLKNRLDYDVVFEAIGPVINLSMDKVPHLTYVYFPPDPDLMGEGKFKRGLWRLYSEPYRLFYNKFRENIKTTKVLSISDYIARLCKMAWGIDSEVVYFPVRLQPWSNEAGLAERDGVITIGRFSPEKNQREQLMIANELMNLGVTSPFRIVGAASSAMNGRLFRQLRREAISRQIRTLEMYPNLHQSRVISLANRSKVFLHTMRNEHFGISTVEAIAAGCIPIVHDSGGSQEIVPFKELRFSNLSEATERVKLALAGNFDNYLPSLRSHISKFSEEAFKTRVTTSILSLGNSHG